jgi:hypothetical protein
LQCARPCCDDLWPVRELTVEISCSRTCSWSRCTGPWSSRSEPGWTSPPCAGSAATLC